MRNWQKAAILIGMFSGGMAVGVTGVSYSIEQFFRNVQINTSLLPDKVWVRYQTITAERGCNSIDMTKIPQAPKQGWMSVYDYYMTQIIPTFGEPPGLTPQEASFCYADWDAVQWVVQPNGTRADRPMYDGAAWESTRDTTAQWKMITARVAVGRTCEVAEIRNTATAALAGYSYHYVTNKDGVRGLTACVLSSPPS